MIWSEVVQGIPALGIPAWKWRVGQLSLGHPVVNCSSLVAPMEEAFGSITCRFVERLDTRRFDAIGFQDSRSEL